MFSFRPNPRGLGFNVEPLEDSPGLRMNADGTLRDASPGDLSTAFPGIDPGDSAALPGGIMFNVQPERYLPGLHNFRPPERRVPGFRVSVDGPAGPGGLPAHHSLPQTSMQWTTRPVANRYVNGRSTPANVTRGTFLDDIKDLPEAIADRVGALAKGAYSVFPGVYNAGRAAARGVGLLGPEEAERFRRELELIRRSANAIAEHPGGAARAAYYGADERLGDPLLKYHLLGRGAMGWFARVGPVPRGPIALIGDTLRAFENGRRSLVDAALDGVQGER